MLDIVVQIVSHGHKDHLAKCMDSIIGSLSDSDIAFKILILENGSGQDLSDIENRYKKEPVAFHYSEENLGFGAGHNLLAKKENSRYLFTLNPDTSVSKSAVKIMFEFMEAHAEAGLCGPQIDENLGFWWFWWHKKTFWPIQFTLKEFFERYLRIKIARDKAVLEYSPILGSAMFFRRKAFEDIDGFDENYFLYFEEQDICNSMKMKEWKIFFIYDAVVDHFCSKSETQPQNIEIFRASKKYYYEKWNLS